MCTEVLYVAGLLYGGVFQKAANPDFREAESPSTLSQLPRQLTLDLTCLLHR